MPAFFLSVCAYFTCRLKCQGPTFFLGCLEPIYFPEVFSTHFFLLAYLVALSPEVSGASFSYVDWCPPFCPNTFLQWRCPPFPKRSPAVQISKERKVRREMKLLFFSLYSSRDKLCTEHNDGTGIIIITPYHFFFLCTSFSFYLRSALVLLLP
jgi:hypothetical protein